MEQAEIMQIQLVNKAKIHLESGNNLINLNDVNKVLKKLLHNIFRFIIFDFLRIKISFYFNSIYQVAKNFLLLLYSFVIFIICYRNF